MLSLVCSVRLHVIILTTTTTTTVTVTLRKICNFDGDKIYDDQTNDANCCRRSETNQCRGQSTIAALEKFLITKTPSRPYMCRYIFARAIFCVLRLAAKEHWHTRKSRAHVCKSTNWFIGSVAVSSSSHQIVVEYYWFSNETNKPKSEHIHTLCHYHLKTPLFKTHQFQMDIDCRLNYWSCVTITFIVVYIFFFFVLLSSSQCVKRGEPRDKPTFYPPINEHQLAFTPNNTIFKQLVDDVSKRLKLVNAIGVTDSNELQRIVADNGLIAGIEFHHSHVSVQWIQNYLAAVNVSEIADHHNRHRKYSRLL